MLAQRVMTLIYGRAFSFALSLAIPIALTRLLVPDEYGTYQQLILLYSTLQALLLLGLPRSLAYFYPRLDADSHPRLLRQTLALLALSGLLALGLFLTAQMALGYWWPHHQLRPFLGLLGLYTALMLLVMPLQHLLVVEGRERASAFSMLGFTVIDVIVMPGAAWLRPDVWGILGGIVAAAALKALVSVGYIARRYLRRPATGPRFVREQLAYGVPVGLIAMVGIININVDKFLVGLYYAPDIFAVYYIGSLWAPIFGWITLSTAQVVIPRLSAAHKRGATAEILRLRSAMALRLALIFFPMAALLAVVARPLIEGLFTDSYSDAVPVFMIYLLLLPSRPFSYGEVLMASGETRFLFRLATALATLNVVLSYLLLTRTGLGLLALPVATVTVAWLMTLGVFRRSNRLLGVPLADAYPWRRLGLTLTVAAAATIPAAAFALTDVTGWALLFGGSALYAAAFAPLAWWSGVLSADDRALLRALWPW